eukprot:2126267-Lingulodinium_polyedra.AAC.1
MLPVARTALPAVSTGVVTASVGPPGSDGPAPDSKVAARGEGAPAPCRRVIAREGQLRRVRTPRPE